MEFVISEYRHRRQVEAFESYVSDVLKGIADVNLKYFTRNNNATMVDKRFIDVLHPSPLDERTADEIAEDIIIRAGLNLGT